MGALITGTIISILNLCGHLIKAETAQRLRASSPGLVDIHE